MYERQFKRIQKSFQTIRMRISVRKLEAREGGGGYKVTSTHF